MFLVGFRSLQSMSKLVRRTVVVSTPGKPPNKTCRASDFYKTGYIGIQFCMEDLKMEAKRAKHFDLPHILNKNWYSTSHVSTQGVFSGVILWVK